LRHLILIKNVNECDGKHLCRRGKNNKKQNKNVPLTNKKHENLSINISKREIKIKEEKTIRIATQNIQKREGTK
jgi:hypothetical protein